MEWTTKLYTDVSIPASDNMRVLTREQDSHTRYRLSHHTVFWTASRFAFNSKRQVGQELSLAEVCFVCMWPDAEAGTCIPAEGIPEVLKCLRAGGRGKRYTVVYSTDDRVAEDKGTDRWTWCELRSMPVTRSFPERKKVSPLTSLSSSAVVSWAESVA